MTGLYRFNKKWGMAGLVKWTRMLNDAEDRPLVDGNFAPRLMDRRLLL